MQVFYKIVGDPAGYVSLINEAAGDAMETERGSFRGLVQKANLAFSNKQFRKARGNVAGQSTLQWTSGYADFVAARAAIATTNALKLTKLHLKFVEGSSVHYIPNAIADTYNYDRQGKSVTHGLNFEGDDLTAIEPV